MEFYCTFRINSLLDYKKFLFDVIHTGIRVDNPFDKRRTQSGLGPCSSFEKIKINDLNQYLGITIKGWRIYTDFPECPEEIQELFGEEDLAKAIKAPEDIVFDINCEYKIPKDQDFPIIIDWYYLDTFDRTGSIKAQRFDWYSINRTPVYDQTFLKNQEEYEKAFGEENRKLWRRD